MICNVVFTYLFFILDFFIHVLVLYFIYLNGAVYLEM